MKSRSSDKQRFQVLDAKQNDWMATNALVIGQGCDCAEEPQTRGLGLGEDIDELFLTSAMYGILREVPKVGYDHSRRSSHSWL